MPIFEYACTKCGAHFEKLTTRAQADQVACVSCGSKRTERQYSVFGVGSAQKRKKGCAGGACAMPQCGPGGGCASCPCSG